MVEVIKNNFDEFYYHCSTFCDALSNFRKLKLINAKICKNLIKISEEIDEYISNKDLLEIDPENDQYSFNKLLIKNSIHPINQNQLQCNLCHCLVPVECVDNHLKDESHLLVLSAKKDNKDSENENKISIESDNNNKVLSHIESDQNYIKSQKFESTKLSADISTKHSTSISGNLNNKTDAYNLGTHKHLLKSSLKEDQSQPFEGVSDSSSMTEEMSIPEGFNKLVSVTDNPDIKLNHIRKHEKWENAFEKNCVKFTKVDGVYCIQCEQTFDERDFKKHRLKHKEDDQAIFISTYFFIYYCKPCTRQIGKIDGAIKHITLKTLKHNNKLVKYKNQTKTESIIMKRNHEEELQLWNTNFITFNDLEALSCNLCKDIFLKKHLKDHRKNLKHKELFDTDKEEFTATTLNVYYCQPCNKSIGLINEAIDHLTSSTSKDIHLEKLSLYKKNLNDKLNKNDSSPVQQLEIPKITDFLEIISDKNQLKIFLDEKIQISNVLKEISEYKSIKLTIEQALKNKYPNVNVYLCGPRIIGIGCYTKAQHIFIDTGFCYNRWPADSREYQMLKIKYVTQLLQEASSSWRILDINNFSLVLYGERTTDSCSYVMTFTNGLDHSRTKLLMNLFNEQPVCKFLCITLQQIVNDNKLDIYFDSYVICVLVVFYMQINHLLPSIKKLLEFESQSYQIGPWRVVHQYPYISSKEYPSEDDKDNKLFEKLVKNCLDFYANEIDFKNEIISTFLGQRLQKAKLFECIPQLYKFYNDYPTFDKFEINSPICVQDVFELNSNITQLISEDVVCKFVSCVKEGRQRINW